MTSIARARPTGPTPAIRRRLLDSRQPSQPRCRCGGSGSRSFSLSVSRSRRSPSRGRRGRSIASGFCGIPRLDRLPSLVEELVRLKVDLIVAPTSIYTGAAQRATSTIPIVFASHADPIGSGHVASLAHPGTNATGLTIKQLAQLALTHKLPSMFGPREHVEAGGLMSYSPDRADLYRRAATYVDKILKGANPADLPVQQATKFELVINLKTAKALGLTIPQSILVRADEVIQ
jgi:ABC-type uncharacterized transport system substrate-binding protein